MKILFAGGGTGGHFYPIISVAEELSDLVKEKKLLPPELFYMAPTPYDAGLLYEKGLTFKRIRAGKLRKYTSIRNLFDLFKTLWGTIVALFQLYKIYPDVVFGKGGYASFPVLLAARILRIPVVIHESDTVPGRVNIWAGKFAERVALSWKEGAKHFPKEKVAFTGNPVRKGIETPITSGAREYLGLDEKVPVIFILGGSQGAQHINDIVIEGLAELVKKYAIIHQTGKRNIEEVKSTAEAVLFESPNKDRYKPYPYLDDLAMRMAAGSATVVISRAGSAIFEIASWGVPSIIIPIKEKVSRDQRTNAFSYARSGACSVIEEENLTVNILISEINRLVTNDALRKDMEEKAKAFFKPNAGRLVAEEILKIALSHEIAR